MAGGRDEWKPTGLKFPFAITQGGSITASEDRDSDIRGKIIQVLFTAPGERVNLPEFGRGLLAAELCYRTFRKNSSRNAPSLVLGSFRQCRVVDTWHKNIERVVLELG